MTTALLMFACLTLVLMAKTMAVKREPCFDSPSWAKTCKTLKVTFGERICTTRSYSVRRISRLKCKETCGRCNRGRHRKKAQAPPIKCDRTRYGCCWDRATAAKDPQGKGCPPCIDRHVNVCRQFRWMCGSRRANSDYIKFNCPIMCGFCQPKTNIDAVNVKSYQSIISKVIRKEYLQSRKLKKGKEN